jgi:hypothetical protein
VRFEIGDELFRPALQSDHILQAMRAQRFLQSMHPESATYTVAHSLQAPYRKYQSNTTQLKG